MSDGVITLKEIEERARGEVIEIPDWDGKGKIKVRVRKIDVTPIILESGLVPPNSLKVKAQEAFEGKRKREVKLDDIDFDMDVQKFMPVLDAVAKAALVEPTYQAIQEILPLTLSQKMAIFDWVMGEVKQLESFRVESRSDD